MKPISNFYLHLHNTEFTTNGIKFRLEKSSKSKHDDYRSNDTNTTPRLWVFPIDKRGRIKNALRIDINWLTEEISFTRCPLGKGDNGTLIENMKIHKPDCTDPIVFTNNVIGRTMDKLMSNGVFH